jgi:hypothetical protein
MNEDLIVERIVGMIRNMLINMRDDVYGMAVDATDIMDVSEAYRLAFLFDAKERVAAKREMRRIRAAVFKALRLHDLREVEK